MAMKMARARERAREAPPLKKDPSEGEKGAEASKGKNEGRGLPARKTDTRKKNNSKVEMTKVERINTIMAQCKPGGRMSDYVPEQREPRSYHRIRSLSPPEPPAFVALR